MSPDTVKIVLSVVFAAGIVVARLSAIERRVQRIEKQLDDHIMPEINKRLK